METGDISIDYTGCLVQTVGEENGLKVEDIESLSEKASKIQGELTQKRENGELPFYDLPYQNLTKVMNMANPLREGYDNLVVMGIGGSALGARALAKALMPPYQEILSREARQNCPRMFVTDNVDPDYFTGLIENLDLAKTCFIVISKSGGTAETMSQFLYVRERLLKKYGRDGYRERMRAITDKESGYLREIVDLDELEWLAVPDGVGGRFSVLTPVGLLPAAVCGIDIFGLLKGAGQMDKRTRESTLKENPACLLASLYYLFDTIKKKNVLVMMPYASGLLETAEWFQQLWAESLGKAKKLDGSPAHTGSTPVRALGATDQHSQVQLYMEGPADKLFTFLRVKRFGEDGRIPEAFPEVDGVGYLGGQSLSSLINHEQRATEMALAKAGRPGITIELPECDSYSLGQLMYLLEVATVFAGGLYEVNPLDQPGVEMGKKYAKSLMGKKGMESDRDEVKSWFEDKDRYKV